MPTLKLANRGQCMRAVLSWGISSSDGKSGQNENCPSDRYFPPNLQFFFNIDGKCNKFPLMLMWVLTPDSACARPSAQSPIDTFLQNKHLPQPPEVISRIPATKVDHFYPFSFWKALFGGGGRGGPQTLFLIGILLFLWFWSPSV